MVIVCPKCKRQYQIDTSRIPAEGTSFTCWTCRSVVPVGVLDGRATAVQHADRESVQSTEVPVQSADSGESVHQPRGRSDVPPTAMRFFESLAAEASLNKKMESALDATLPYPAADLRHESTTFDDEPRGELPVRSEVTPVTIAETGTGDSADVVTHPPTAETLDNLPDDGILELPNVVALPDTAMPRVDDVFTFEQEVTVEDRRPDQTWTVQPAQADLLPPVATIEQDPIAETPQRDAPVPVQRTKMMASPQRPITPPPVKTPPVPHQGDEPWLGRPGDSLVDDRPSAADASPAIRQTVVPPPAHQPFETPPAQQGASSPFSYSDQTPTVPMPLSQTPAEAAKPAFEQAPPKPVEPTTWVSPAVDAPKRRSAFRLIFTAIAALLVVGVCLGLAWHFLLRNPAGGESAPTATVQRPSQDLTATGPVAPRQSDQAPPADTRTATTPADTPQAGPPGDGRFTVQIQSSQDEAAADELASRLKAAGNDAYVMRADLGARGVWYRVRVGRFTTREEARAAGNRLRSSGATREFIVQAYEP